MYPGMYVYSVLHSCIGVRLSSVALYLLRRALSWSCISIGLFVATQEFRKLAFLLYSVVYYAWVTRQLHVRHAGGGVVRHPNNEQCTGFLHLDNIQPTVAAKDLTHSSHSYCTSAPFLLGVSFCTKITAGRTRCC